MQTILITGGAGFIGSHLADRLLNEGYSVVVADNFCDYYDVSIKENNVVHNLSNQHYKLYRTDIEDMAALKAIFAAHKFDVVVHLAARAGVRPSIANPADYVKTNVLGTVNVLECMKKYDCKKLVVASSSSVYGNCSAEKFSEDLNVNEPISPYAATKLATEQLCYTYHHLYDINVAALRFFTAYGPRQRPDLAIAKFAQQILQNKPIEMYGDGSSMRDYTYIDDIVSGIVAALKYNNTDYEIINLGGGNPITLKAMIQTLEECLGKKAIIELKPMQQGDVDKTVCDWQKAHRLLGYVPQVEFR
jgi:UDP-glucuronate 4-epimerase